nr:MAG TPA: hypothetical protein [Caudoviricetes sp.]
MCIGIYRYMYICIPSYIPAADFLSFLLFLPRGK